MEEERERNFPMTPVVPVSPVIQPITTMPAYSDKNLINKYDDEPKTDNTVVFKKEISNDLRSKVKSIIEPNLIYNLRSNLKSQIVWRRCGNFLEIISKVIMSLSAIPAYLASAFQSRAVEFSVASGVISTVGALLFLLGSKAQRESKERSIISSRIIRDGIGLSYSVIDISEPAEDKDDNKK